MISCSIAPFAYWDGEDHSALQPFLAEWRAHYPQMRVLGDADIEPVLTAMSPDYVELYGRLRFAAAKADVARLAALHEFGGLYIDCHCGLCDPEGLTALLDRLDECELIILNKTVPPWPESNFVPMNGMIAARRHSSIIRMLLETGFDNLRSHAERECREGHVSYSIYSLIGAGNIRRQLTLPSTTASELRPEYKDRVFFVQQKVAPIRVHIHNAYRLDPCAHWSNREKMELLFSMPLRKSR